MFDATVRTLVVIGLLFGHRFVHYIILKEHRLDMHVFKIPSIIRGKGDDSDLKMHSLKTVALSDRYETNPCKCLAGI